MKVIIDRQEFQKVILQRGLTINRLSRDSRVSKETIKRIVREEGILPSSYRRLCAYLELDFDAKFIA